MTKDGEKKSSAMFAIFSNPALVAVILLAIGAILITVGVSLLWKLPAGLIVFGLILLVLGVLLGLTT